MAAGFLPISPLQACGGLGQPASAGSVRSAASVASSGRTLAPKAFSWEAATISSLETRVKQLEEDLQSARSRQQPPAEAAGFELPSRTTGQLAGPGAIHDRILHSDVLADMNIIPLPIPGTLSKTRFFGQSHWLNGADLIPSKYRIFIRAMDRIQHDKTSEVYERFRKCKELARVIKARRLPSLPALSIGTTVPDRLVSDCLVDAYLRTFETVYRILHVPSFQAEYERYWLDPNAANQTFVVLMQLCMAIGACFYDETCSFRTQATGWIYEARVWLMMPPDKSRLSIPGLQIMCLLQVARQTAGVGGDLTWISAGSLLRSAMYMGLHHDPDNLVQMSPLRAEIRRRLWTTILEICLQASLEAGGLPLISLQDHDTQLPADIDDNNLPGEDYDAGVPTADRNTDTYTRISPQLAFASSFAIRLAITNHVNGSKSGTGSDYQATLRLSAELEEANRTLLQRLHSFPKDDRGVKGVSPFQLRFFGMVMNRHLLALHLPWWHEALQSPSHYFSRKISVDAALTIAALARSAEVPNAGHSLIDVSRLLVCGSGPYRSLPVHVSLVLGLELMAALDEARPTYGLVVPTRRCAELQEILDWSHNWWGARIRAGETNIKAYAFGGLLDLTDWNPAPETGEEEQLKIIWEKTVSRVEECYQMLKDASGVDLDASEGNDTFAADSMGGFLDDFEWDNMGQDVNSDFNFNTFGMMFTSP
jgi:hypothetical protein